MAKQRPHKIFASDVLDDLLKEQARPRGQHWLLSYLDVFVLVVMLMVTLVAITEPKSNKKKTMRKAAMTQKLETAPVSPALTPNPQTTLTPSPKPISISAEKQVEQNLNDEIKRLGMDNQVKMSVSKGLAQFDMQENVLFESSAADLSPAGEDLLLGLIPLLIESEGPILIEGHSDNRPLKSKLFKSNWELSSARANSVLHFLASQDVDPNRMRAVSFGDTKPIADNKTKAGREKNRRVNIVMQIDNLPVTKE